MSFVLKFRKRASVRRTFFGGRRRLLLDKAEVCSARALTYASLGLASGECLTQAGHKIWPKGQE